MRAKSQSEQRIIPGQTFGADEAGVLAARASDCKERHGGGHSVVVRAAQVGASVLSSEIAGAGSYRCDRPAFRADELWQRGLGYLLQHYQFDAPQGERRRRWHSSPLSRLPQQF